MEKGALRQQVLWLVREKGPCSTSDVCEALRQDREISLNAVQTVLNRLVEQGLLTKNGTRRHFLYEAIPTEDAIKETATHAAMDLLAQTGELGLAHFVETIDKLQPDAIQKLERLLADRRAKREKS